MRSVLVVRQIFFVSSQQTVDITSIFFALIISNKIEIKALIILFILRVEYNPFCVKILLFNTMR